ncbi:MAG TPA: glucose 1-dehydrogenase [Tepidisphaeraceae bacterium]|jgi:gluconate 5-dehydrogenase
MKVTIFGRMNVFQLDNEVALITGGGTGLGFGIARCMVSAGAKVILAGRREEVVKKAAEDLGPSATYVAYDVTQMSEAPGMVQRVSTRFGPISILVNNAGINLKKPAMETTEDDMLRLMNTNVIGAHALTRAAAPSMLERKHGSVIFIASAASLFGIPFVVAYSAAKTALIGVVRTLSTELSPSGVRVNAIAPGWIESEMSATAMRNDPSRFERVLERTPLGRFGKPEDVGYAAVYLSSNAARFVTGSTLVVDGGISEGF